MALGKRAWRWRKGAWRGAIVKVARGNTTTIDGHLSKLGGILKCSVKLVNNMASYVWLRLVCVCHSHLTSHSVLSRFL